MHKRFMHVEKVTGHPQRQHRSKPPFNEKLCGCMEREGKKPSKL